MANEIAESAQIVEIVSGDAAVNQRHVPDTVDFQLDNILLDGAYMDANITNAVTKAEIERTIEGASTVTLELLDEDRELLRNQFTRQAAVLQIDNYRFRMVKVSKKGDYITLIFEDEMIYWMRKYKKFKKAYRDKVTRAQFARSLAKEVKEVRIDFYSPDLKKKQPVKRQKKTAGASSAAVATISSGKKSRGLNPRSAIRIKGQAPNEQQRRNLEISLNEATKAGANELCFLAMLVAGIGESSFTNIVNSKGYGGVFQGQVNTGGRFFTKEDTRLEAYYFLHGGKGFQQGGALYQSTKVKPRPNPGVIAGRVEGSTTNPIAFQGFYNQWLNEAKIILAAYGGPGGEASSIDDGPVAGETRNKRYAFSRGLNGKRENTWDCLGRLADEVNWRRFVVGKKLYFISETTLMKAKSKYLFNEDDPAVNDIDFDFDVGKKMANANVEAFMDIWQAPPGSVVEIKDLGPADGRWLVESVKQSFNSPLGQVVLRQPRPQFKEPAPQTETVSKTTPTRLTRKDYTGMSPKQIIDEIVIPTARELGFNVTPASVQQANHIHGHVYGTNRTSDHEGPPSVRWAADISNGHSYPDAQKDKLANRLAEDFGMRHLDMTTTGQAGSYQTSVLPKDGYQFQLIYRSRTGGNHDNHVHFGVHTI